MGSRTGSFKTAAAKIGILPADYTQMRLEGNKWCAGCKTWLPANWFYHLCGRCVPCNRQHNRNLRAKAIDTKI